MIAATSSTKNTTGERDPELRQSKKGNHWYFGKKARIGVDAESGLVHTVRGTSGDLAPCRWFAWPAAIAKWSSNASECAALRP